MQNKYVLITGGTGGLGLAVTQEALKNGAKLITLPVRSQRSADALKASVTSEDLSRLRLVDLPVVEEGAVESLIDQMGQIDVLIHVLGGFEMGRTDQFAYQDWQKMLDLNLNSGLSFL